MGMGPRRLLALHSNLMRTGAVSIRLSDSTARDAQKGPAALRQHWKECISTALLTASNKSVVARLPSPSQLQSDAGQTCVQPRYIRGSSCILVECWRWRNRVQPAPEPFVCVNGR
jgi:hypothetical protein